MKVRSASELCNSRAEYCSSCPTRLQASGGRLSVTRMRCVMRFACFEIFGKEAALHAKHLL